MTVKNSRKELTFVIIALFVCTSITPALGALNQKKQYDLNVADTNSQTLPENVVVTCYTFGYPGKTQRQITMSRAEAEAFYNKLKEAQIDLACDPFSEQSQHAQQEIISLAHDYNLVSEGFSLKSIPSPLLSTASSQQKTPVPLAFGSKATERICTFVTTGSGAALPIIILPRFIPFLLTPIPRVFVGWNAREGITSCGGLLSGTGFIAYGPQKGLALGFWGIGLTFSLPPVMNTYGLIGYALYATVEADYIERYPPNNPPVVSGIDPGDGEINVPLSLSEIRFRIEDADADLMSYSVTTTPDIGSGQGNLKTDGVYSIPISGLQSKTLYTWHIDVTDGEDTSVYDFSFTTEPVEPIISNPVPTDGERLVPTDITELKFTLKDYQGDAMDYTVETSPDVGSASKNGVHDGTFSVPVGSFSLTTAYRWYVNVTDGVHWTRKIFSFETGYPAQFNPFEFGWQYRKQITIDHTKVAGELSYFPVLINIIDSDLSQKAQADGDDILFMNSADVSTRLNYEIESFNNNTGALIAWVNVTHLSSSEDTMFYMYYGNPSCLTQQYPEKTWDSNYVMVQHMKDITTSTTGDSTCYAVGGTKKAANEPLQTTGRIGYSQDFDGTDDCIAFGTGLPMSGAGTVSFWFYYKNTGNAADRLVFVKRHTHAPTGTNYQFSVAPTHLNQFPFYNGVSHVHFWTPPVNTWAYVTIARTGVNHLLLYVNGTYNGDFGVDWGTDGTWQTAFVYVGGSPEVDGYYCGMKMDELRVSNYTRTAQWISTEYNNQNDPSGFLNVGPEEPGP
jgi:hypothetical protein